MAMPKILKNYISTSFPNFQTFSFIIFFHFGIIFGAENSKNSLVQIKTGAKLFFSLSKSIHHGYNSKITFFFTICDNYSLIMYLTNIFFLSLHFGDILVFHHFYIWYLYNLFGQQKEKFNFCPKF